VTPVELNARTNQLFWERTGYKPGRVLDPADPRDREMARAWLAIREELSGANTPATPATATPKTPLYLMLALVGATGIIAVQNRRRIRRAAAVTASGAKKAVTGARRAATATRRVATSVRDGAGEMARQIRQIVRAEPGEPEDERTFMEKYGAQYRAKHGTRGRLALPAGEAT
jgi:hypothetical protein